MKRDKQVIIVVEYSSSSNYSKKRPHAVTRNKNYHMLIKKTLNVRDFRVSSSKQNFRELKSTRFPK